MELLQTAIPWSFIRDRVGLTWREALFGLENDLAAPDVPVEMAIERLAHDEDSSSLVELASAGRGDPVRHLVEDLASKEPAEEEAAMQEVWVYLTLAWVFENRHSWKDPLSVVETIYADFGYPAVMAGFVRYMPTEEPDLGSREANEERLISKWKRFLDEQTHRLREQRNEG